MIMNRFHNLIDVNTKSKYGRGISNRHYSKWEIAHGILAGVKLMLLILCNCWVNTNFSSGTVDTLMLSHRFTESIVSFCENY